MERINNIFYVLTLVVYDCRAEQQIGERVRSRRSRLDNLDTELRHIETALDNGREKKGVVDRELTIVRASVNGKIQSSRICR